VQNDQTLRHPKCKDASSTKGGVVEEAFLLLGVSSTPNPNPSRLLCLDYEGDL